MSTNRTDGSGEKPGHREAMRRMEKQLVDGGTPREQAARIARNEAIKDHEGRGARRTR